MKELLFIHFVVLCFSIQAFTQVVSTDPIYPYNGVEITIIYNTYSCNGVFKDYSGDIYAHTGVMTDKSINSDDWKYVKTNWAENTEDTKLTKINDSIYHLIITTSITSYYGVPSNDVVEQMAFVFRNSDGSQKTNNIYINVFQPGINVNFGEYSEQAIFEKNSIQNIEVNVYPISTYDADSIFLYQNDSLITTVLNNNTLSYDLLITGDENQKLIAKVVNSELTMFDTLNLFIKEETFKADIPAGTEIGINYINDSTVTLVFYAPYKKFVYLIGDMNNWQLMNEYLMNMTPDSTMYWITLNNLAPAKEYIYQYLIDGKLRVADPYTEKTSDSYDQYIPESIYPNLIDYPTGKTTEIASVLQTKQEKYTWEVTDFEAPVKEELVIYELLIRDFSTNSDIQTVIDSLDYLERLGINAIELMPFSEFEGNESWGYNPSFYFAPDKTYGTKNNIKKFIDECHKRGIAVIMDIVLNHSYGQSPMVRMYQDNNECGSTGVSSENPWYNQVCPSDYCWGYDFNHESKATEYFVDRVTEFWIKEYNIDGYRFDFTKGFTNKVGEGTSYDASRITILKRIYDNLYELKPNGYYILEHWADNSEEIELSDYGFMLWGRVFDKFQEAIMGYNTGSKSDFKSMSYKNRGWNKSNLICFMESHDEERVIYKAITWGNSNETYDVTDLNTALSRAEAAAAFYFTVPGPKMIWMFGELGYDISIDYDCRVCPKPIKWDYLEITERKRLYQAYSALIKLKTQHDVFNSQDFTLNVTSALKSIHINHSYMNVTVIGNFGIEDGEIDPEFQQTGTWYEYITGEETDITDINKNIKLKPGEYRIYTSQKLEKPSLIELPTNLRCLKNDRKNHFLIYPNPSSGFFSFYLPEKMSSKAILSLFNMQGKLITHINLSEIKTDKNEFTWNASSLNKGIYFLNIKTETEIITKKITIF